MAVREFTWRDGERTIIFRAGSIEASSEALAEHGWGEYELLTTERRVGAAPMELAQDARAVHYVPRGPVNEVSAAIFDAIGSDSLVALGGGRVIDAAKAIAAARDGAGGLGGARVAALPTTLSGAEMTRIHRLPDGHEAPGGLVRPALVIADAPQMATLPEDQLRASAMNALAHGADSLYTPLANPVSELAALRGAKLLAEALDAGRAKRDPATLALGSILCGYAIDSALFGLHHVVCQTLVRVLGTPHAETNATMLPHTMEAMRPRAGPQMTALARALGTKQAELAKRIETLGGGPRRLADYSDADRRALDEAVKGVLARPELRRTPDPPDEAEVRALIERAW